MKKQLFLHVGHGKTGSSYIQSILSTHRETIFNDLSIFYPVLERDRSAEGKISSGNGAIFLRDPGNFDHVNQEAGFKSLLYSSEFLFALDKNWLNRKNIDALLKFYERINVLLFVRNPDEMLSSSYQQAVKRSGYVGTIDDYTPNFNFYRSVEVFIKKINQHPEINLSVFNYSNSKKKVAEILSTWLGSDVVLDVPYPVVNRSLTYAELVFQQELNKVFGKSGDLFSDNVCEEIPHIKSDRIYPSSDIWRMYVENNRATVDIINNLLPVSEAIDLKYDLDNSGELQVNFNLDQIKAIANSMLGKLKRV